MKRAALFAISIFLMSVFLAGCASQGSGITAEELYQIGMAYYDLQKFDDAEKWLTRAAALDKTQSASEYQLGRLAYETGKYNQAIKYFQNIIRKDPNNTMALKACAYSMIKMGDTTGARGMYERVLTLEPESADDGYNYALVLYAMEDYAEAEATLAKYKATMADNKDTSLLYARCQKALNKPEAIDDYDKWLAKWQDPQVNFEYGEVLEKNELYAKALENYQKAYQDSAVTTDSKPATKGMVGFAIARTMMLADSASDDGMNQLRTAIATDGFKGEKALEELEKLAEDTRIGENNQSSVRTLISRGLDTVTAPAATSAPAASESGTEAAESAPPAASESGGGGGESG